MRLRTCFIVVLVVLAIQAVGQQSTGIWTLEDCISYAISHNISIKQDSLNARLARYAVLQSELAVLPSINGSGSYGKSYGRSINPTTNQFVEGSYNFLSISGTANVNLFGGFQNTNNIKRNRYSLQASLADLDQLKNDVSLNVANAFLAAVLAREQINVSRNQLALTMAQLEQTSAFVTAGKLPELNLAQLESQVATDSANLINSISNYNSALLDLKALLNLDFTAPFDIQVPDVNADETFAARTTTPEEIYQKARGLFGSIKAARYRVSAAERSVAAARGGIYPQLSAGYQVGSNYASNYQTVSGYTEGSPRNTGAYIYDSVTAIRQYVYSINAIPIIADIPFSSQIDNNLRHSIYLSLNLPVFNGWQTNYNIKQARINLASQQLSEYSAELTLKQNVYKAHNAATNAIQKYLAARRAEQAATRAQEFAKKRYDLGLTTTVDLLVTQNAQYSAASNLAIAKYDLIFKLKVIDYYLGRELKL